ncbi:DUF6415 family natural product biosynthesis protein [Streptomyces sp. NPDC005708]|uniref:DUF6415 family natural product biosynthesis protein n=1 Tax=Streptomyces sp. NPDC005708 TaxID=3154564 RepID=UPI0034071EB0
MSDSVAADSDTLPPDVATMRHAVNVLLDPDAVPEALPPVGEELKTLTLQIKGHLQLLIPEVRAAALQQHKDSVPRYCALACLGEASNRLGSQPSPAPGGDLAYARRLARTLNALCDHFEQLGEGAS